MKAHFQMVWKQGFGERTKRAATHDGLESSLIHLLRSAGLSDANVLDFAVAQNAKLDDGVAVSSIWISEELGDRRKPLLTNAREYCGFQIWLQVVATRVVENGR